MNKLIKSVDFYECTDYDRYVRIEERDGQIIGLNYWQGIGDFGVIEEELPTNDPELLKFYFAIEEILINTGEDFIERINLAINAHFEYENN